MSTYQAPKGITGIAGTAIEPYRFVALAADGEYDHAGDSARMDGVSGEGVAAGVAFPINVPDGAIVKVEAGAAVVVGTKVVSDATGRAVTDANPGVGGYWGGIAKSAAGAAGDVIEVQFIVDADQVA